MKKKIGLTGIMCCIVFCLGACTVQETKDNKNKAIETQSATETGITEEGLIEEQTFQTTLDGWGDVTFASFQPNLQKSQSQDVTFALFKNGKKVFDFPEMYTDNERIQEVFDKIDAVTFNDYNEDGKKDIIILSDYQKDSDKCVYTEVRLYTQNEGGNDFELGDVRLVEYLMKNKDVDSIEAVKKGIKAYYQDFYSVCTNYSKLEVEKFAEKAKKAILSKNYAELGDMIKFPITIQGVEYKDKKSFENAGIVFSKEYLDKLKTEETKDLFANWQGIMIGDGEVWIGEVLDQNNKSTGLWITAINDV